MSTKDVEQVAQELNDAWKTFQETNDKREEEIKKHGRALGETQEKLERVEEGIQELQSVKEQLDAIDNRIADMDSPGKPGKVDKAQEEHVKAWENWLRNPRDGKAQQELYEKSSSDVLAGTNSAGGHAVPEVIARDIERFVQETSPMRGLVKVVQVGTTDYKELVDLGGASSGWVGESANGNRTQTNVPELRQVAPTFGTLYAYAKATEEALQDIFFDVRGWIVNSVSEEFAKQEGSAIIDGDGSNKPTGMLNTTPESTDDNFGSPSRTAGALQYLATGISDGFGSLDTGSPGHYPSDVLYDTVYKLKNPYRRNGTWIANRSTLGTIRKFKDSDGNYIWQPGLQMGEPDRILGFPVAEMPDMPDIAANAHPVAFGDFSRAYVLADRVGLSMTVDDNITDPGVIKFYIRRRMGGITVNDEAVKVIKCASS